MTLRETLKQSVEETYNAAEGLMKLVPADKLDWKPATGTNWMTTGQLLQHCTNSCGLMIKCFVTGDWGMPDGANLEDMKPEEMMPPAEKLPTVDSVEAALKALAEDKAIALKYIDEAGDAKLASERSAPPWGGPETSLGAHVLTSINHLAQHKGQLFYYLKLQGQDINTQHLWGM